MKKDNESIGKQGLKGPTFPKPKAPRVRKLNNDNASFSFKEKYNEPGDEPILRKFLFSTTLLIEGIRCFSDIPVTCDITSYPNRNEIFKFTCDRYNREVSEELFNSFAILNIYEFKSNNDFNIFLNNPQLITE